MATVNNQTWKDEIRRKLITIFGNTDLEGLARVLFYLDEEDKAYNHVDSIGTCAPAWKTLKATLNFDAAFKTYAERLIEDTKRAEKDANFRMVMNQIYTEMITPSTEQCPEERSQGFQVARNMDNIQISGAMGLVRAWPLIPAETQRSILRIIPRIVNNRQLISSVDEVVGLFNRFGGNVVMVGLAAVYLSYDAIINIKRWWKGEISGKRCCKNIVDSAFSIGAGMAGGIGGAALGSLGGPIGALAGGIIGGIISSSAMAVLIDRLTQSLFGIPKDEALENAYNFFNVSMTADNTEINSAFRKLCLKHHPDKGGKAEDFHQIQVHMQVIKTARGQFEQ